MAKPLSPTTQGVGAVLRKAGFRPSKAHTTRIRGYHSREEGYRLERHPRPELVARLSYVDGGWKRDDARHQDTLRRYREALETAGYTVYRGPYLGGAVDETSDFLHIGI